MGDINAQGAYWNTEGIIATQEWQQKQIDRIEGMLIGLCMGAKSDLTETIVARWREERRAIREAYGIEREDVQF